MRIQIAVENVDNHGESGGGGRSKRGERYKSSLTLTKNRGDGKRFSYAEGVGHNKF